MSTQRRVRLSLAYDGTDFEGWQYQPDRRTVQGTLDEVLTRLQGGRAVRSRGAGRTDAGVHARGQVADAALSVRLDDEGLLAALSKMLPPDVRPLELRTIPDAFHARHDARLKTYRYELDRSPTGDPFRSRYALHVPRPLDAERIEDAARRLVGTHDWTGFAASACEVQDRVRTLTEARFETDGAEAAFTFSADGFLTHMVRNMVGTLLEIGRNRMRPGDVERVLESRDRSLGGPTAPAHGLTLMKVEY